MQFLYPTFLFALAALAIPIIIHLFYFRRFKKVYFTNVKFLKEVKEETSARQRLRNLLVLLMRCLAVAFLVLAFSQPFIPKDVEVKKGEKSVSVFVDNSFSMSALSQDVPLLEKAKQKARDIINAYQVEDRFQIITNDFEGRHQRLVSKEDALTLIDEIKKTPSVRQLSQVLQRQQQALNSGTQENQLSYLISDFQKNITDLETYQDTSFEINLVPLQSVQEKNISIDTAYFDAPVQMRNQTNPLVVKVKNLSNEDAENIRLSLNMDGQSKPVGTLTIAPNKYVDASFAGIDYFKITNLQSRNLDYSKLPDFQLIVMNGLVSVTSGLSSELSQYVVNGGNLLVFPAYNANIDSYKNFLVNFRANELTAYEQQERIVADINTEEFVFKDVFENRTANLKLPVTQGNFKLSSFSSRKEERLMSYRDGSTYLAKYKLDQGNLYLCAAPLNEKYNNLVRSGEIFIPMFYKMSISTGREPKIAYTIGKDDIMEADNKITGAEMVYKLKGRAEEFIPEQKTIGAKVILGMNNQISEAGFYNLFLNEGETLAKYAFNYDRKESKLAYFNEEDLEAFPNAKLKVISGTARADFGQLIGERNRGVILWKWCLILALLFLALEVLLLRLWKA